MTMDTRSLKPVVHYNPLAGVMDYIMSNAFGWWPLYYICFPLSQFWVRLYGKLDAFCTKRSKLPGLNFFVSFYYEWLFFVVVLSVAETVLLC